MNKIELIQSTVEAYPFVKSAKVLLRGESYEQALETNESLYDLPAIDRIVVVATVSLDEQTYLFQHSWEVWEIQECLDSFLVSFLKKACRHYITELLKEIME